MRFSKDNALLPFDNEADLKRTVIRSNHRLTKTIAATALAGGSTILSETITNFLRRTLDCTQRMRSKRLQQNALNIALHEENWPEVSGLVTFAVADWLEPGGEQNMTETCDFRLGMLAPFSAA